MNYDQALAYIHAVHWQGHKPGLERIRILLDALGRPEQQLSFVHVAGTNGKGSTAAMLDSCLRAAGYKVGLFTSPYIGPGPAGGTGPAGRGGHGRCSHRV